MNELEKPYSEGRDMLQEHFETLDNRLKNAYYWMTDCTALNQTRAAILEARGVLLAIKEEIAGRELRARIDKSAIH